MTLELSGWDWAFLAWFLAVSLGVGVWYTRRAGSSLSEYFLSGRDLPWWALGTSMIATSFASDTPLIVAGFVLVDGVAKNWVWWNFLIGGTLTVFVFSRAWRRARLTTEIELIARRYDGAPARLLRGFKAVYLGLLLNSIVFGWVTKAMDKVLRVVLPQSGLLADSRVSVALLVGITLVYTALSGLWGVVATDVLQFAMAMIGAVLVAVLGVAQAGGLTAMVARVHEIESATGRSFLTMLPTTTESLVALVLVPLAFQWWAVYYPGAEPGGGGYVAQRMFAAKDERHARAGTLWYIVVHYALRPWPWILTGLAALVLEPRFAGLVADGSASAHGGAVAGFDPESAYPWMFRFLPVGMLGLVVASFFAAYMSTITSLLNLSASYLVNDLWLPLTSSAPSGGRDAAAAPTNPTSTSTSTPTTDESRRQVVLARICVVVVALAGCFVTSRLPSAGEGWTVVFEYTAGTGLVLLARWLWWRVNAWSEIAAMAASIVLSVLVRTSGGARLVADLGAALALPTAAVQLPLVAVATSAIWIAVTLLTPPTRPDHLARFFTEVRPGGAWGPVARATGLAPAPLRRDVLLWFASTAMVYGFLFAMGHGLLGRPVAAAIAGAIGLAGAIVVGRGLRRACD